MAESIVKELAPMIFQVIAQIPYGRVASYGQIARSAGIPKHSRLVGYVLKHMDADSSLPWYRVINSQGKISLRNCMIRDSTFKHSYFWRKVF